MIYSIDKFEAPFGTFSVTFVRVATGIGWYGTHEGSTERYGDYVAVETTLSEQGVVEMFEVLADQAADSLTKVFPESGVPRDEFANYLRAIIKDKAS